MDITLESDADALWQDALDLLEEKALPGAFLAMLRSCTPASYADGVLRIETPMRIVVKKVSQSTEVIEECLSTAAFEPVKLAVSLAEGTSAPAPKPAASTMTAAEAHAWEKDTNPKAAAQPAPAQRSAAAPSRLTDDAWDEDAAGAELARERRRANNPLVEDVGAADSKLTFDRFVRGDENSIAYESAVQVANGVNRSYNLLFIYGKSGLGKTHLLRAIQNYIAKNDPSRICVYKDASSFITDYVNASRSENKSAADELRHNYADIDVLIIDDVQSLAGKAGTINFFFDTFNTLRAAGKWIVLAADRTPSELGMGKDAFDERVTSRMGGGITAPVEAPSYELKVRLIEKFCERAVEDARREHMEGSVGTIPEDVQRKMAERAGNNIRVIEGFCQRCLIAEAQAEKRGETISPEAFDAICEESWGKNTRSVSIEAVQKTVEKYYDISHADLVGSKRNKSFMEPRHVAIWLSKKLCEQTLADIGKHFGGRSHATVMHSLRVVDQAQEEDRVFRDRLLHLKSVIEGEA